jgi:O-antigen ligase
MSQFSNHRIQIASAVLLIAYSIVLPIRSTASLQAGLLISGFILAAWLRYRNAAHLAREALWVLKPLLLFSLWIFLICIFWKNPTGLAQDANIHQPWYSLNLWRRDIAQPMLALLAGFWVFRENDWKRRLFIVQGIFILVLGVKAYLQFHYGELVNGSWQVGTLFVRGFSRDNNWFGFVLLLLTPAAFWLVLDRPNGSRSLWRWAILLILFYIIFLNKRRGTWIAVYLELIFISAWLGRKILVMYLIASLSLLAIAHHVRPEWFHREYDRTEISRLEIIVNAKDLILQHPWVGVGFGKDTVIKNYWMHIYQHTHNAFANIALAIGLPGLCFWIFCLAAYARRFWKARTCGWAEKLGFALLLAFCVRNFTDDIWTASNAELFWFTLGVLMPSKESTL